MEGSERTVTLLGEWHVGAPLKWPLQVIVVWEELHWRFFEELKEEHRPRVTLGILKFYALMPDELGNPPLQLPRTLDLRFPEGWFMSEVMPRIERRERMLWKMTWEGPSKVRAQGQPAGGDGGGGRDDQPTTKNLFGRGGGTSQG